MFTPVYMNDLTSKIDKKILPERGDFLQSLKHVRYDQWKLHPQKMNFKNFKTKDLGAYDYLHVQSKTLLLTDVFPNFQIMYFKIYGLNPARFLNPQGLICQATLKKLK